jgi:mRNA interferase YafQ
MMLKRGYDRSEFDVIVDSLRNNIPLPFAAHPHKIKGEWAGMWECHIEPDWLLIYNMTVEEVILHRTGTHADLFE